MKNEEATTTQSNSDPKPGQLLLWKKICCAVYCYSTWSFSLIYATSWWGQAFEFMIIDVDNLVNSV